MIMRKLISIETILRVRKKRKKSIVMKTVKMNLYIAN